MASSLKTLKMPPDLLDVAIIRANELGYDSWSAYIKGLICHDAMCRAMHGITVPWSKLTLLVQDRLYAVILWRTKRRVGMRSAELAKWDWEADYQKMMAGGE